MCGLIYARSKDPNGSVSKRVAKHYKNQKMRGRDGYGLFDRQRGNLVKETKEERILRYLKNHTSNEILFHHRLPTSTENVKNAAHPFTTKDHFGPIQYILIHNGHIDNAYDLKKHHDFQWHLPYTSLQPSGEFNDSEALLWDIALTLEGKQEKPKAFGSCAFIMLELHMDEPKLDKLHYYRNNQAPLYRCGGKKMEVIVSQPVQGEKAFQLQPDMLFTYTYAENSLHINKEFAVSTTDPNFGKSHIHTHEEIKRRVEEWNKGPKVMNALPANIPYRISEEDREENKSFYNDLEENEAEEINPSWDKSGHVHDFLERESAKEVDEIEKQKQWNKINDSKTYRTDLEAVCMEYLNVGEGFYEKAVDNIKARIFELQGMGYTFERWYETQLLEGAMAILIADPFWADLEDSEAKAFAWLDSPSEDAPEQTILDLPVGATLEFEDISSKVKRKVAEIKDENAEDLNGEVFTTPINTDTASEILVGTGTDEPIRGAGIVHVGEVLNNKIGDFINRKFNIKEVPSLVTEIPRKEIA